MSGPEDWFQDGGEEDEELLPKTAPSFPPAEGAETRSPKLTRSIADEIVDAVKGVKSTPDLPTCKRCGSTDFEIISPIAGGTRTRRCLGCRQQIPLAAVSRSVDTVRENLQQAAPADVPSPQLPHGSFYGSSIPEIDPSTPMFRRKSK